MRLIRSILVLLAVGSVLQGLPTVLQGQITGCGEFFYRRGVGQRSGDEIDS